MSLGVVFLRRAERQPVDALLIPELPWSGQNCFNSFIRLEPNNLRLVALLASR